MKDFDTHRFLKLLNDEKVKYHYEGKWLVINDDNGYVDVNIIGYGLPDYIKFNNEDHVDLSNNELTSLPNHIEFNNGGPVDLYANKLI